MRQEGNVTRGGCGAGLLRAWLFSTMPVEAEEKSRIPHLTNAMAAGTAARMRWEVVARA
jgi:hypothetical protein